MHRLFSVPDRLYAVESARLVAEQENEDLHRELNVVNTRVSVSLSVIYSNSDSVWAAVFCVLFCTKTSARKYVTY